MTLQPTAPYYPGQRFNRGMQYEIGQKAKEMKNHRPATAVLMFNSTSLLLTCTQVAGLAPLLPLTLMKLQSAY